MKIDRSRIEELLHWLYRESLHTFKHYEYETAAREGSWNDPIDREYLRSIKDRSQAIDVFCADLEGISKEMEDEIDLDLLSAQFKENAEHMLNPKKSLAFASLMTSCLAENRFPKDDEMKAIFDG